MGDVMEWRSDIENAPRDGTAIIALIDGEAIQARWRSAVYEHGDFSEWEVATLPSHGCGCCSSRNPKPTHWMSLPTPPEEAQK